MLDTISDAIGAVVEIVASALHGVLRLVFRMGPERPAWLRIVAAALVVVLTLAICSVLFAYLAFAVFVVAVGAALAAVVAFLGLG
jgi:uncharacterized BrkB/YihY/UPF0761 family membrane protein